MSETERRFAFGAHEVDGCLCPARQAGAIPIETVAFYYDAAARRLAAEHVLEEDVDAREFSDEFDAEEELPSRGILPERLAREAWREAMEAAAADEAEEAMRRSRAVTRSLGWD